MWLVSGTDLVFYVKCADLKRVRLWVCYVVVPVILLMSSRGVFSLFRTPWKRCCFSGDGEYIVAGSARQHALYIWEKSIGNLVKILHGTRGELLLDVAVRMLRDSGSAALTQTLLSVYFQSH